VTPITVDGTMSQHHLEAAPRPAHPAHPEHWQVRRIVTGTNAEGRSVIVSDTPAPHFFSTGPGLPSSRVLWSTGDARPAGSEPAPAGHEFPFHSRGGSILRVAEFPPDASYDPRGLQGFLEESGVRDTAQPRHFWFHKTDSLDYAIVLEGEIVAMMDEGEVLMRPGDVLVQRATNHSWSNRSDTTCRIAFVLLDLRPDEPL
jgi:mannose-6-phosphate isomerase-like protein (cupin superfamily)